MGPGMQINPWMAEKGLTATDVARLTGTAPSTITRVLNGEMKPSAQLCRRIELVSHGRVLLADLVDEDQWWRDHNVEG